MFDTVSTFLLAPLGRLTDLGDPFSLVSLFGALVVAILLHQRRRGRAPGRAGLAARLRRARAFLRAAFSARLWWHPSTRLDYRLFVLTALFYATGAVELVVTSHAVEAAVTTSLDRLFGPPTVAPPGLAIVALVTLADLLVFELAYWFAHWLLHRVPALWAFHALHHSAEVLTPVTEWRQHPIELFLFPVINAVFVGGFFGVTHHLLGPGAQPIGLFGFDVLQFVGVMTVLHLRHSHLWLTLPGLLGRIFQSPAHHQIHHSTDPRHFDKNLGLFLSVWDWAFGTLWVPEKRERLTFGLGPGEGHHTVREAWLGPFVASARALGLVAAKSETPAPTAPLERPTVV